MSTNLSGGGEPPAQPGGARFRFGEVASEALRYWERWRVLYNLALLAVVVIHLIASWPASKVLLSRDRLLSLVLLAVVANILYCAAYGVDLFVQFSGLRAEWTRRRWMVLATGIAVAAILAHFVVMGILGTGPK